MWLPWICAAVIVAGGLPSITYPVQGNGGAEKLYEIYQKNRSKECPAYFFFNKKKNVVEIQGKEPCLAPIKEAIEGPSKPS